jgi:hypothetical protein
MPLKVLAKTRVVAHAKVKSVPREWVDEVSCFTRTRSRAHHGRALWR